MQKARHLPVWAFLRAQEAPMTAILLCRAVTSVICETYLPKFKTESTHRRTDIPLTRSAVVFIVESYGTSHLRQLPLSAGSEELQPATKCYFRVIRCLGSADPRSAAID